MFVKFYSVFKSERRVVSVGVGVWGLVIFIESWIEMGSVVLD